MVPDSLHPLGIFCQVAKTRSTLLTLVPPAANFRFPPFGTDAAKFINEQFGLRMVIGRLSQYGAKI